MICWKINWLSRSIVRRKEKPCIRTAGYPSKTEEQWIDLCDEENNDRYKKIPNKWFDALNIQRPPSQGSLKQPLSMCLFDNRLVYTLFRAGILVEVPANKKEIDGDDTTEWRPLIPRVPKSKKRRTELPFKYKTMISNFCHLGKYAA